MEIAFKLSENKEETLIKNILNEYRIWNIKKWKSQENYVRNKIFYSI